jgi:hypothetical protein
MAAPQTPLGHRKKARVLQRLLLLMVMGYIGTQLWLWLESSHREAPQKGALRKVSPLQPRAPHAPGGSPGCERCDAMAAFVPSTDGGATVAMPTRGNLRPSCARRRVYLDLGANWGNTARMHERFADQCELRPGGARWEVFGFEASPLIQPFVDDFYAHLRGERDEPLLCLPKAGSTQDLRPYADRLGCTGAINGGSDAAMKRCIFEVFARPLRNLVPRRELNDTALIRRRLAASACFAAGPDPASTAQGPAGESGASFTLVPAAAGGEAGWLSFYGPPEQLIRGGARPDASRTLRVTLQDEDADHDRYRFTVPVVDVAGWMMATLADDDYVVAKMDIEGSEHALLGKLIAHGRLGLIDVLAFECHSAAGDCHALKREIRAAAPAITVWVDGRNYTGLDAHSRLDGSVSATSFAEWRRRCALPAVGEGGRAGRRRR